MIGKQDNFLFLNSQGSTSVEKQIKFNFNGFSLRGAQNDGKCYYVDESVTEPIERLSASYETTRLNSDIIDTADVKTYYEDPVLTFEDSLVYGCSLELNLAEF